MSEQRMSLEEARELVGHYRGSVLMDAPILRAASTIVACGDVLDKIRDARSKWVAANQDSKIDHAPARIHTYAVIELWLEEALGETNSTP